MVVEADGEGGGLSRGTRGGREMAVDESEGEQTSWSEEQDCREYVGKEDWLG
jgi:hypothetical protein